MSRRGGLHWAASRQRAVTCALVLFTLSSLGERPGWHGGPHTRHPATGAKSANTSLEKVSPL